MIKVWVDYLKVVNGIIIPLFKKDDIFKIEDALFDAFDCIICILFENTKSYHFFLTNDFKNMV